jgi:hypothetical protein
LSAAEPDVEKGPQLLAGHPLDVVLELGPGGVAVAVAFQPGPDHGIEGLVAELAA